MSADGNLLRKRGVYQSGSVICNKCGAPINIFKLEALNNEFSVHCKKCGQRDLYSKNLLKVELLPERRKKPRR